MNKNLNSDFLRPIKVTLRQYPQVVLVLDNIALNGNEGEQARFRFAPNL